MSSRISKDWIVKKPAVTSSKGIVCAQSGVAAEIGANILDQGGNAIDAAIATSFALGAAEPWMSGIGGGGYMIIRKAGEDEAKVIDFGMKSPMKLDPNDYPLSVGQGGDLFSWPRVKDDANLKGAKSVAIPGQVSGMGLAHRTFGSLPWEELVNPAVNLASEGLPVDWYCQLMLSGAASEIADCPMMRKTFFNEQGFPKSSAWTALGNVKCDLNGLARTLDIISREGSDSFYKGDLANSIVKDLQEQGGRHSEDDFSNYRARIQDANKFSYRGHHVFSTPELTAGPTLQRVYNFLESNWNPKESVDAETYIAYERAIREAYQHRFKEMGDCVKERAPSCTTHFNVIDESGTMVAVTQTLLSIFGSKVMLPESGIMMNNGVMWFDPEPGKPNSIGPNKRCLSNMCPTLLERSDGAKFALGSAGGRKILPAVAQLGSLILDYKMNVEEAIHSPRLDMSSPDMTFADDQIDPKIFGFLENVIPNVKKSKRTVYPYTFACPSAAELSGDTVSAVTEVMSPWGQSKAQI